MEKGPWFLRAWQKRGASIRDASINVCTYCEALDKKASKKKKPPRRDGTRIVLNLRIGREVERSHQRNAVGHKKCGKPEKKTKKGKKQGG